MKKIYALFIVFILFGIDAKAQLPTYSNTSVAAGANAFPLNSSTTQRRVQWFIPPNSLGAVPPGNNITVVYFQTGSAATRAYPIINVKLKVGAGTGLTGIATGPPEAGMTTVYTGINQTISSTLGGWISFTLTTPFLYDPTLPLIVELEHNATTGTGPTIYQAVSIPGPGNGRQWMDYAAPSITGVGTQQVNFGIDVIPSTPCTTAPPANSILPLTFTTCPGLLNPNLTLASTYSFGGITYQWQSSTVSPVGPFTSISNATLSSAPVPTIGVSTWFQVVATCTNTGGTTTLTPTGYVVGSSVVKTVPYVEDFEGIPINNRLPNCSWYAANLGTTVTSYTTSASDNRVPRSGNKFVSFGQPSTNNIVYSNGITMSPGITYSAALWYATEYFGYNNWTSLSILLGASQSVTGLIPIATISPAVSGAYKALSGTFTVSSPGDYYIAIRATASTGSALYLSFDDLSVTIPCNGLGAINAPTLSVSAPATTVCSNVAVNLTASGADTYTWNTGSTSSALTDNPSVSQTYTVWGTNLLTGCVTQKTQLIQVDPAPNVYVFASTPSVCIGQPAILTGLGAVSYVWSNGASTSVITVSPTVNAAYNVIGTALNGCTDQKSQNIQVKALPNVSANSSSSESCKGEMITLSGNGAVTYQWLASGSGVVYLTNPVNVVLNVPTNFTLTGTDANGCTNKTTLSQNVNACTDIKANMSATGGLKLYPNPGKGYYTLETNSDVMKTIEVLDYTGKLIMLTKSSEQNISIDLSNLANGIYYVKVSANDKNEIIKVVKN